jgi:TPR repeat protein
MFRDGLGRPKNLKKAFHYFCIAASHRHALAYYALYEMMRDNLLVVYIYGQTPEEQKKKKIITFEYLKESAKEGYTEAMYTLGNEYLKGNLCKQNYVKALAWHRHACRNGYFPSYEVCGDIFYKGGLGVSQNKALSLVWYYCGYTKGLFDLKDKIIEIIQELKKEGEPLPEMVLI